MSFNALTSPVDLNGSALRTGLINIKPFEISRTIKRFGTKFTKIVRGFEALSPARSFPEIVTQSNQAIFSLIEIPARFEADKLVELYTQNIIQAYEQDIELKESVKKIETKASATPLSDFVSFIKRRLDSYTERNLEEEAVCFLNSNFPLSFYNRFVVFNNVYLDFLNIVEKTVKYYETISSAAGDSKRRNMYISQMKKKIAPMIDQMDTTFLYYLCLKRYIRIWNCETYEDIIGGQIFLDINKVDATKLKQLVDDFEIRLSEARKQILRSPYWKPQEFNFNEEPTGRMVSEIIMMS
jgi:hypothetical protein